MDILGNMPVVYHEYAASYIKFDFFLIAIEIRWNRSEISIKANGYFIVMNISSGCFQAPVLEGRDDVHFNCICTSFATGHACNEKSEKQDKLLYLFP